MKHIHWYVCKEHGFRGVVDSRTAEDGTTRVQLDCGCIKWFKQQEIPEPREEMIKAFAQNEDSSEYLSFFILSPGYIEIPVIEFCCLIGFSI